MSSAADNELEMLKTAFSAHKSGNFEQAERAYREILRRAPENATATQLIGALCVQTDRFGEAVEWLELAVELGPDEPSAHINLGTAYSRSNNLSAAAASYRRALGLDARSTEAHRNLGSVLYKLKEYEDAERHLLIATSSQAKPDLDALTYHGLSLLRCGRADEAIGRFQAALAVDGGSLRARIGLGQALLDSEGLANNTENLEMAESAWRSLVKERPDDPAFQNNLATVLKHQKKLKESAAICEALLARWPGFFPAACNLGIAQAAMGDFEASRRILEAAVQNEIESRVELSGEDITPHKEDWPPHFQTSINQLASACNVLGDDEAAVGYVEFGLKLAPEDTDNRLLRGFLNLQMGKYELGWADYEYRKRGEHAPRSFDAAEWSGQPVNGCTILIHAEQGLGDSFHFVRYARLLKQLGANVVFLCHSPVARLVSSCEGVDAAIADGDTLPNFDFHIPLLSLPGVFKTSLTDMPNSVPYIFPASELLMQWRERLSAIDGFKVAIAWQGNREFAFDEYRSVPLKFYEALSKVDGAKLISIQQGDGTEQIGEVDFDIIQFDGIDDENGAFMDTAAIMSSADLVVSSDTATVHLAGALACQTWLAKSKAAEWRWIADANGCSPWYPTLRMFQQQHLKQWGPVFESMAAELRRLVKN